MMYSGSTAGAPGCPAAPLGSGRPSASSGRWVLCGWLKASEKIHGKARRELLPPGKDEISLCVISLPFRIRRACGK